MGQEVKNLISAETKLPKGVTLAELGGLTTSNSGVKPTEIGFKGNLGAGVGVGQIQFNGQNLPTFYGDTQYATLFAEHAASNSSIFILRSYTNNQTSGADENLWKVLANHKFTDSQGKPIADIEAYYTRYWDTNIGELTAKGVKLDTNLGNIFKDSFCSDNKVHAIVHYIGGVYDPNELGFKLQAFENPSLVMGIQHAGYGDAFQFNEAIVGFDNIEVAEKIALDIGARLSGNERFFFAPRNGAYMAVRGKELTPLGLELDGYSYFSFSDGFERAHALVSKTFDLGDDWSLKLSAGPKASREFLNPQEIKVGGYAGFEVSKSF